MNVCDILAYDFFTAGGLNSLAVKANCSLLEPAQITSLITNGLVDAESAEQGELTHMRRNDLVEAMQKFIDRRPDLC